jgi:hypothetical protein
MPAHGSQSRRAILTAAASAALATVATALARPLRTQAATDHLVRLNNEDNTTVIEGRSEHQAGFSLSGGGVGVYGYSESSTGVLGFSVAAKGVHDGSDDGVGVYGGSLRGTGVEGGSGTVNGVQGSSQSSTASGVYGDGTYAGGYGVAGRTNAPSLGVNNQYAAGVLGENIATGVGVWARSAHGVALYADAVNANAFALRANGVSQFKRSGRPTILAGHSSVSRSSIRIDPGTLVLASLQQDRPGVYVRSTVPNAASDAFTIRLNKAVTSDTKVAWFLVN